MHRHTRTALLAAALLLAACEQPAGGGGGPKVTNPPETAARELALGQPVDESLESGTDVDDFAVTVPTAGRGMLLIVGTGAGQGSITITAVDSASGAHVATATAHGTNEGGERFNLPAGRLLIRVKSTGTTGGYRFTVHAIATGPESGEGPSALRQWAAGDLAPYYDVDEYAFDGVEGQEIKLYLNVQGGGLQAVLRGAGTAELVIARSWLWSGETEPVRLPVTGRYTVTVSTPDPAEAQRAGPYQLMVFPMNRTPEGVPAALQHDQPVTEQLDVAADVDEYTFTAAQGEMFLFAAELLPTAGSGYFHLVDPANGAVQRWQWLEPHTPRLGWPRWHAPHAGPFVLRASAGHGPYRLGMFRVDTRPEQVPAAFALDEIVTGESIDPAGEVDTFEFSGAAGTEVAMMIQAPSNLTMDLLPQHDTTPVARLYVQGGATIEANTSDRFTLPADGTYRVRIMFHPSEGSESRGPSGAYRFRVAPIRYGPEFVPAAIAIGQTVTGESLEHRSDVDVFTFQGQAGERIALWGDKRSTTAGHLIMTLHKPTAATLPMTYLWMTGSAGGTIVLPETGVYQVKVFSSSTSLPDARYTSTYRGSYDMAVRRVD